MHVAIATERASHPRIRSTIAKIVTTTTPNDPTHDRLRGEDNPEPELIQLLVMGPVAQHFDAFIKVTQCRHHGVFERLPKDALLIVGVGP